MEQKIDIALDTNEISDSLRDGVRVNILTDEAIDTYTSPDGTVIKGTGLIKTVKQETNLGDMKNEIARLMQSIVDSQARLAYLQSLQPDIEAAIDVKFTDAIKAGAVDSRTLTAENTRLTVDPALSEKTIQ